MVISPPKDCLRERESLKRFAAAGFAALARGIAWAQAGLGAIPQDNIAIWTKNRTEKCRVVQDF
jgi:hypothetical protein